MALVITAGANAGNVNIVKAPAPGPKPDPNIFDLSIYSKEQLNDKISLLCKYFETKQLNNINFTLHVQNDLDMLFEWDVDEIYLEEKNL